MRTVFLVRHANIDLPPTSNDPDLNAAGRQRADALATVLGAAGVGRIFTSELRRTKQTVAPPRVCEPERSRRLWQAPARRAR